MDVPEDYIDWRGDPGNSQAPPGPAASVAPATVPITVPAPSPAPRGQRRLGLIVAATVVTTLVVAGLAVAAVLHLRPSPVRPVAAAHVAAPPATAAGPSTSTRPPASTASPTGSSTASPTRATAHPPAAPPARSSPRPPSADEVALTRLDLVRAADAAAVGSDMDGRWVPLLAAKTAGIRDPQQRTRSGSHVFGWADILDEHDRLHSDPRLAGGVLLMRSTDYGRRQRYHGKPLYVTFADLDFTSAADVRAWCDETFPELGTALRRDSCSPGRLTPPS